MLRNYLLIAWKVLGRRKFYTFISLFGISFTLLVLMVAASMFDHIFGPYAPETRSGRLLSTWMIQANWTDGASVSNGPPGYAFLDKYVRTLTVPEKVTLHTWRETVTAYRNGAGQEYSLKRTDGRFWEVLDFTFVEGGPYSEADNTSRNFVVVINEATRHRYFGGGTAVGRFFELEGQRYRVVGVVKNVPWFRFAPFADVWVPITTAKNDDYRSKFLGNFIGTVLLKSEADAEKAKEEYEAVLSRIVPPEKNHKSITGGLDTLFEMISRIFLSRRLAESKPGALMGWLLGIAALFMLLPTVNLVNINVSRIIERASEIGVRKAFGASSWTLVGQFIIENVVLTAVGGALGFLLSVGTLRVLESTNLMPYADFHVNYRVFLYGLAMTLFFGVVSGVYPAWKMSRMHPVSALRGAIR